MTNREKFEQMSNEELVKFLVSFKENYCCDCVAYDYCVNTPHYVFAECKKVLEKWLEQEV